MPAERVAASRDRAPGGSLPSLHAAELADPAVPAAAAPPEARGGTLRVHLAGEPPHLHPLLENDEAVARVVMGGLVYETVIECVGDGYRPALAERWELSPDRLRLTLTLRAGVRWHDGQPLDGMDVKTTIETVFRAGARAAAMRSDLADVVAVEVGGGGTVRLRLRRPADVVLRALCDLPILPDHLIRGWSQDASPIAKQPVGTGPFRFLSWERGERGRRIRLARSGDAWWGKPALDEISFEIDPDLARALARTRRGEIDILPRVAEVHYPEHVDPPALRGASTLYRLAPDRYSFLAVNHLRGPLADERFRRALALLWDRDRFAIEVHRGLARPIGGPPFGAAPVPRFDRSRAIALLEEAGYRDTDGDGVRDRGGRPIRLTLLQALGGRALAVEGRAFILELRRAGILVDLQTVPADAAPGGLMARLRAGEFDLAPLVWQGRRDEDPSVLYGVGGAHNFGGYRSAVVESILDELRAAAGPAARRGALTRLAGRVAAEQAVIFLYRHDTAALVSNRVRGLTGVGEQLDFRRVWVAP